jgi:cytochrome P450
MKDINKKEFNLMILFKAIFKDHGLFCRIIENDETPITVNAFGTKLHILVNPAQIEHISKKQPPYFRALYSTMSAQRLLGKNGMFSFHEYDKWQKERNILKTLFTQEKIKQYHSFMVKWITHELKLLESFAENDTPLLIRDFIVNIARSVVTDTLFEGVQVDYQSLPFLMRENLYLTSPLVFPTVKLFDKIPMFRYFRYKKMKKKLNTLMEEVVRQSLCSTVSENNVIKLLANAYGYPPFAQCDKNMKEHLCTEATTFLLAGYFSTSAFLVHVLVYLSHYPLVADKLYAEVHSVLGSRDPGFDDINKLSYTRAVLKETLRLWPFLATLLLSAQEDDNIEGYVVKKNEMIFLPVYALHRLAKYWPNPEGFDPERFLKPLTKEQQSLYCPFSLSVQNCLGSAFALLEGTLLMAMLAQRYRLDLLAGTPIVRASYVLNIMEASHIRMKVLKVAP